MAFRDFSEAVGRIGDAGVKSPFTFWALLAVAALALAVAGGSFWLLNVKMTAFNDRYDRLFVVLEQTLEADAAREQKMIGELKASREEYATNFQSVIEKLLAESPTKANEQERAILSQELKENKRSLEKLEDRQERILQTLEQISRYINGGAR